MIRPERKDALNVFINETKGTDPFTCALAARWLGLVGPAAKAAVPALMQLSKDEDRFAIELDESEDFPGIEEYLYVKQAVTEALQQ